MAKDRSRVTTFHDSSILIKFTIFFILMSLIPMTVLYFLYWELKHSGGIQLTQDQLQLALIFVVLGVLLGYAKMRTIIVDLIKVIDANRKALSNVLSPAKIQQLTQERNEIAVLAQSFMEITSKLEDNVRSLELAKKTLHSILDKVGRGISNMENIDTFLSLIMETVADALSGKIGVLLMVDSETKTFYVKTVYGRDYFVTDRKFKFQDGTIFSNVFTKKYTVVVNDKTGVIESELDIGLLEVPFLAAPLMVKDKLLGILVVSGRKNSKHFDEEDVTLINNLASQTAVAIENSKLNKDMERTYFETIAALALAVDAKDKYSRGHLDRVAKYSIQIGKKLGLDQADLKMLRDAARLHDIGKIGIPDIVLSKGGPLNEEEWILMRKHPEIGESIIKPIRSLAHLCDIVRHHHEKLDGTGYPDGLKGNEISPLVRITTIADIYDALTTNRSYRLKLSPDQACKALREMKDKVDQDIVEVFIESLLESK